MADFVFNVARGRVRTYVENVKSGSPANSRLIAVPLETTGLEADAALRDHDTLAALLAGTSNEQITLGRKTIAAADIVAVAQDDVNERLDLDFADLVWAASAGNAISAVVICYAPDGVTPGADTTFIPLTKHDFVATPDGTDITAVVNAAGFYRSA